MKCIVLAAGYATRLYPLTENFPKPLLPIHGKPLLDYLLDDIDGCTDGTIIVTNHKFADHFRKWEEGHKGISVIDDGTSSNETRLGAVKDLELAVRTLAPGEDALVMAGDNLLDFSLSEFVAYAREKGSSCIMRYFEGEPARLKRCGVMEIDESDMVLSMVEKPAEPKSNWCCPPFYYYTAEALKLLPEAIESGTCGTDAPGSFAAWIAAQMPVHAFLMPGKRTDIGTLEDYQKFI